jgi:hypothetical protein
VENEIKKAVSQSRIKECQKKNTGFVSLLDPPRKIPGPSKFGSKNRSGNDSETKAKNES